MNIIDLNKIFSYQFPTSSLEYIRNYNFNSSTQSPLPLILSNSGNIPITVNITSSAPWIAIRNNTLTGDLRYPNGNVVLSPTSSVRVFVVVDLPASIETGPDTVTIRPNISLTVKSGSFLVNSPATARTVTLLPSASSIVVGTSRLLTAIVRDANNNNIPDLLTWNSSNTDVATVSTSTLQQNVVEAISAGTATITAKTGVWSGSATITAVVLEPVVTVEVAAPATIAAGTSQQLTATLRDVNNNVLTNRLITWTSTAPTVVTVSATGLATALQPGTVSIIARSEEVQGSATIAVSAGITPVSTVAVVPATIFAGTSQQLTATLRDVNNNVLLNRAVTWTSNTPTVATISATGNLTAMAAGTASIIATSEGKTGTAPITVRAAGSITVGQETVLVKSSEPSTLNYTIFNSNGTVNSTLSRNNVVLQLEPSAKANVSFVPGTSAYSPILISAGEPGNAVLTISVPSIGATKTVNIQVT